MLQVVDDHQGSISYNCMFYSISWQLFLPGVWFLTAKLRYCVYAAGTFTAALKVKESKSIERVAGAGIFLDFGNWLTGYRGTDVPN